MRRYWTVTLSLLIILLCGCTPPTEKTDPELELDGTPPRILINEVLTGEDGDNQADFIELFNTGTEIANLEGYSLWYQLNEGGDLILIHEWDEITLIPPLGHYALNLVGQEFSVLPDLEISQPLVPSRGSLSLRKGEQVEDQLCWGTGPSELAEGAPAPAMKAGYSLVRKQDPETGMPLDSGDNQKDFILSSFPLLQNTGSPILTEKPGLVFSFDFPETVKPGEEFEAFYEISNQTGIELVNPMLFLPLPEHFSLRQLATGIQVDGKLMFVELPNLLEGETFQGEVPLEADLTFSDIEIHNIYIQAENWHLPAFSGPIYGEIGGGAIPIKTARELIDREVLVEGTSTMYVGGFYAGSGAKFYIEDESAGLQIYLAGAGNSLVVPLGAAVQVRGTIQVYRDTIELVPASEASVKVIESDGAENTVIPRKVQIAEITAAPENFPGNLVTVEGKVARIEEFSYSYEIDLFDDRGNLVNLYIDKNTGISIDEIRPDQNYRITGIMELYDGILQLYPRLQSDLERVFEPGLALEVHPPTTALPGETFQVVYTLINYAPDPDRNLVISARIDPRLEILDIQNQGRLEGSRVIWDMSALDGGAEVNLAFSARFSGQDEFIVFDDYRVISSSSPQSVYGPISYTFSGDTVPIWAIQGPGERSPHILSNLTTSGVVTGVFPEMDGFWIQEIESDEDPATSPGLFVRTGPALPDLVPGDLVVVSGTVKESSQQTEVVVNSPANIEVIGRSDLPDPIPLEPPLDGLDSDRYYESLEGCLVEVSGWSVVVGPSSRYGEFVVIKEEEGISRSWQDRDHGNLIHIDDGSSITHDYADTLPYALNVGDSIIYLEGPLAFTYGNYKVEPTSESVIRTGELILEPLPPTDEGYLRIMSWNVENLFDFVVPHPSSPPLPNVSEYRRDIYKVALTIEAAGFPTVIGFQEVENLQILEDIAVEPALAEFGYQPILIEGTDSRGIDVGYLVRGDRAEILDQAAYPAPGDITSRPPLLVKILPEGGDGEFYILNNHFTSMSGGEQATEPRRNAQAAWNVEIANELLAENPDAYLVVLGDLNSYYDSVPIMTLESSGLTNLFDTLEPDERYTYIYEGNSQVLDHILVNDALLDLLISFEVLHSNADYALPLSSDTSLFHKSDHDPVIATFVVP